jgi:hypothetical protein
MAAKRMELGETLDLNRGAAAQRIAAAGDQSCYIKAPYKTLDEVIGFLQIRAFSIVRQLWAANRLGAAAAELHGDASHSRFLDEPRDDAQ